MKRTPIIFKLSAPVLLFSVLWLVIVFLVTKTTIDNDVTELEKINRLQLEERVLEKMEKFNSIPEFSNKAIEQYLLGVESPWDEREKFQLFIYGLISATKDIDALYYGDESGEFLGYARFGSELELMVAGRDTNHAIQFYSVGEDGRKINLVREKEQFIVKSRPWYVGAKKAGRFVWGEIFYYHAYPFRAVPTSMPVFKEGGLIGVVGNNFFMNTLSDFLSGVQYSSKDRLLILNQRGQVIASNTFSYPANLKNSGDIKNKLKEVADPVSEIILQEYKRSSAEQGSFLSTIEGQSKRVDVINIQTGNLPDWKMLVYSPNISTVNLLKNYYLIVLSLVCLLLVLLLSLFVYIGKKITDPIKGMSILANKMVNLHFGGRINYIKNDELGDLAVSLNTLSDNLKETRDHLSTEMVDKSKLNERLQLSLKASKIGVWDWYIKEDKLIWDEQMFRLYGLNNKSAGDAVAFSTWLSATHKEDADRANQEIQSALSGEKEFDTDFRIITQQGQVRVIRALARVIRDDEGKPQRMLGVNWDITEEREKKMQLERAVDELTQFAYRTSHDLRSPISSSLGLLCLIKEDLSNHDFDEVMKNIVEVEKVLENLNALISDILALSKADVSSAVPVEFDIEALIHRIIDSEVKSEQTVEFHVDVESAVKTVLSQRVRVQQILYNLISNAVKYADFNKGSPYVKIVVKRATGGFDIKVEDNGTGIPEKHIDEIFKMFARFHSGSVVGTGLGLAIVKKHIESLHGTIDVKSNNQGSVFSVYIPELRGI